MKRLITLLLATVFVIAINAQTTQKITLEDLFVKGTFKAQTVTGLRSMNNGDHYSTLENNSKIVKYSYKTGEEVEVIFDISKIDGAQISSFSNYEFSNDETKILLTSDVKQIYRHSFTAEYYVWNSITEELSHLSEKGAQQVATFSPDGTRVAFVRTNNIFIKNLKFGSESQVTSDGEKNKIINGIPDWVYEEEFGFNKAFWWSPDSKFLAFIRFDETEVPEFTMPMYAGESPSFDENKIYPGEETFKYPKAGEKNSDVSVLVYEIRSKTSIRVKLSEEKDNYIPRLNWTPDANELLVMQLNRHQNKLDVLYVNPYTGDSRPLITEKNDRYIDESFLDNYIFLEDGNFVITSERDGWSHLYLYDQQGFELAQITDGEFDVTDFYGYDPIQKVYYYQAAAESPLRREVYFISQDKKKKGKVSKLEGTNRVVFSKNFKYYINYYSSSKTPNLITLHENKKGTQIRVLQDNTILKNTLEVYNISQKEFFKFTTSEGVELNGYMIKPAGFDSSKKYPVLMTQYSGPNSQSVSDSWGRGAGWNEYLVQEGFLVVCVDPRGTAARGEDFRKVTYMQLGKYESDDQVEAAKYLGTLPFVDKNNIAIFGWSYGGFMTLLAMEKGGDLFKAGISVAPVTNWRFYDTVYTERYMRTPRENENGYDDNSPLSHAGDIKGKLLIVHGSADDNVHAQNTYEFTEKMVQEGVEFDMAIYTNRNHGIRGGNTSMHLYNKMTNFLKEQLQ
ncbi:MAG: S9 family peptidase [Prolixibacteraceae bacterium]|jgi:dipeptidyl-peptidase 4|nr:S9 family peptidase [Prolixibacteraceae bacterium]MBT6763622.1 S9 family peptidase [Prolixibacteraceae bacterium]MBT6999635.1 S9 family peptidase [Prolixibacteraceae bacterium]MBT7394808.1 S9 family peptidase [Prolixibacteraceae bacterium]